MLPSLSDATRKRIPTPASRNPRRAFFLVKKMLPEYVFDTSKLENNPLTFPEVQTLLDGVTIGEHRVTDVEQVLNIRDAWNLILTNVQSRQFALNMDAYNALHALVARNVVLE